MSSKRPIVISSFCLLVVATLAARSVSQERPSDPETEAMMAKMKAYAEPGEHHQSLGALVGTFECDVKFWTEPATEPEESTGLMVASWILGNRYVRQEYKSEWMGEPFEGFGLLGYDNAEKKFFTTWMDSMGTGIFLETGTCDPSGKNFTFSGENFDPQIGKKRPTRTTLQVVNNNKHIMRMFNRTEDGKEFKNFEMIATRK